MNAFLAYRAVKERLMAVAMIVLATLVPLMIFAISVHVSQGAGMMAILVVAIGWLAVFLDASVWMFIALGRNGTYRGMERLRSAAWRGAVIAAPFFAFCLGLPPDYADVVNLAAVSIAAVLGGFLWFHAIEGSDKALRPGKAAFHFRLTGSSARSPSQ